MLTISILGHGAVGLSIGSLLINANYREAKINFYSPNKNIDSLTPFIVYSNNSSTNIGYNYFFNESKALKESNIIIICLKLYDLIKLSKHFFENISDSTIILIVSNGIENSDLLKDFILNIKTIDCLLYISCKKEKNQVINYSLNPKIIIDSKVKGGILESNQFHTLFEKSGIKIEYSEKFPWEAWRKLIITSSVNGVCIYFDCSPKEVFANPEKLAFLKSLLTEGADVAKTLGLDINNKSIDNMLKDILSMPQNCQPSMYYDFKENRRMEIDYLNGKIANTALLNGIKTPFNNFIINKTNCK